MKKKYLLFVWLGLCSTLLQAQYSKNEGFPYFIERNPCAAADAMGGTNTAAEGNIYSIFYNPAGIANLKGLEIAGSMANQTAGSGVFYNFGAVGIKWNKFMTTALSFHNRTSNFMDFGNDFSQIRKIGLTLGSSIYKNLDIGVNLNYFESHTDKSHRAFAIDVGAKYKIHLTRNSQINIGADIKNLTASSINYPSNWWQDITIAYNLTYYQNIPIPTLATVGISFQNKNILKTKSKILGIISMAEYQYNCRSQYFNTLRFGTELLL